MNAETFKNTGFKHTGFGCVVRQVEISVWIVESARNPLVIAGQSEKFGVYLFHGAPAGQFWKNSPPLVRVGSLPEAREKAEQIFGIVGSGALANLVTAEGHIIQAGL